MAVFIAVVVYIYHYMKYLRYLSFLVVLIGCRNPSKQAHHADTADSVISVKEPDHSRYPTRQDTILIVTEIGDTLRYGKAYFNRVVDEHPEFFKEYPDDPDEAYDNYGRKNGFPGEVGQDTYYTLYAYFLKQKNGAEPFALQRQKLVDIYSRINLLFGRLQYGGTFFMHQHWRILGYAEYAICLLPKDKSEHSKTYDITRQKELYIRSLRQLIADESSIDSETLGPEKKKRDRELNQIVDELDGLITELFYLRRAQAFHYGYYEYY